MPATLIRGDARKLPLAAASVDLIVTSPPYWSLRSYTDGGEHYNGQIGAEPTPAAYVDSLVECTREWVRTLKPSGSLWVNLGDKYGPGKSLGGNPWRYALRCIDDLGLILRAEVIWAKPNGLPESVTDRVRRSHETWFHFTRSPRYFSAVDAIREPAVSANRPGLVSWEQRKAAGEVMRAGNTGGGASAQESAMKVPNPLGKLPGSVWTIATQPLKVPAELGVDHFAAFPMEWPRRIITGWSPSGICTRCGEGRRPVPAAVGLDMTRPQARRAHQLATDAGLTEDHFAALLAVGVSDTGRGAATQSGTGKNTPEVYALADQARAVLGGYAREYLLRRPTGFREACACPDVSAPTRPAVVLDPFGGTGTTALVADVLGRHGVSVDYSGDYTRLASWRVSDPKQRARAGQPGKPARVSKPKQRPEPGPDVLF